MWLIFYSVRMYEVYEVLMSQVNWGGGVLLGILGGGVVPPGSPNPDPVSDQKMSFSTPVIRPDPQNPYTFSDLAFRQKLCHHYLD